MCITWLVVVINTEGVVIICQLLYLYNLTESSANNRFKKIELKKKK